MDKEDYEFGKKVVELLQRQFAKMALTKHKHTDIWDPELSHIGMCWRLVLGCWVRCIRKIWIITLL